MTEDINQITSKYDPEKLAKSMQSWAQRKNPRAITVPSNAIDGFYQVYEPQTVDTHEITYELARIALYNIIRIELKGNKFHLDASNQPKLTNMIKSMIGDIEGEYPPTKGIYLWGDNSRGKTWIMTRLIEMINMAVKKGYSGIEPIKVISYKIDIMIRARAEGNIGFLSSLICGGTTKSIYIDDLGYNDDSQLILFGQRENVLPEVINLLYKNYLNGHNIYISSNIDFKKIYEIYGNQPGGKGTGDRLMEMCTPVLWKGDYNLRTNKID